ncbi:MAG: 5-formyltetrahydrofolate cyclo-ligase [Butyrivibrio sp.]|nr:5-formyltetrahydrofolate cyclo-ligase [Butyrivibrio sp.]
MTKEEARKEALLKRDALKEDVIKSGSRIIFEKLKALLPYQEAENILIYASMRSEVITDEIISDALLEGKKVFCPKVVDRKNGIMKFVKIHAIEDLKEGYFGIREPEITDDYLEPSFEDGESIVIMPLVCFDDGKNRIGYSGGFYDRYLAKHNNLKTIAIAFECQHVEGQRHVHDFDIAPDMIVTEESIY